MNLRAIAHQPAFMIGAGLVALLLVLALLRKGTGSRGTAAAAQSGVVANPSQGPTQASDVGATAALGAIQQHISSFEQDLSTWVAQNPHVPTPTAPTPTPTPVPTKPPANFSWTDPATWYTSILGRPADPGGLATWQQDIGAVGTSRAFGDFLSQPETQGAIRTHQWALNY